MYIVLHVSICDSLSSLEPKTNGVRIEAGVHQGDEVSVHYDPVFANMVICEFEPTIGFTQSSRWIKPI